MSPVLIMYRDPAFKPCFLHHRFCIQLCLGHGNRRKGTDHRIKRICGVQHFVSSVHISKEKIMILDREGPWKPSDELLAHLRTGFLDPQHTMYFFAMRGFYFEYTDVGDFQLKDFAKQAKRLRNLFQQGKLVRPR